MHNPYDARNSLRISPTPSHHPTTLPSISIVGGGSAPPPTDSHLTGFRLKKGHAGTRARKTSADPPSSMNSASFMSWRTYPTPNATACGGVSGQSTGLGQGRRRGCSRRQWPAAPLTRTLPIVGLRNQSGPLPHRGLSRVAGRPFLRVGGCGWREINSGFARVVPKSFGVRYGEDSDRYYHLGSCAWPLHRGSEASGVPYFSRDDTAGD
jgi:hypothetical protein